MIPRLLWVVLAICGAAYSQGRDFFPWWDMPIARDLNLSDEQMQKVRATVREYRDRLVDMRANVEKSENQLGDLINEDHPDQAKVHAAIDRTVAARSDLTRTYSQMAFRLRLLLTPQQWKELQKRRPNPPVRGMGPDRNPMPPGPRPPLGQRPPMGQRPQNPEQFENEYQ